MTKRRIQIVVQRYGAEIIGGAEAHARALAEQLQTRLGYDVTIVTTTANSYQTWRSHYPKGHSVLNGVKIVRFSPLIPRLPFFGVFSRLLLWLRRLSLLCSLHFIVHCIEWIWIIAQGPYTPALVKYLKSSEAQDADVTIFFTYLYYPTVAGLPLVAGKKILVPTAHDEPALSFQLVRELFLQADVILANSDSERLLIERKVRPTVAVGVAGVGVNEIMSQPSPAQDNFVLYLGRLSKGKGVNKLIDWYQRLNTDVPLILAGELESGIEIPASSRIKYVGKLSEQEKYEYLQRATVVINPSPLESLSMIVLEAAESMTPMLLNLDCAIFQNYIALLPTAFGFRGEVEFKEQLSRLLERKWRSEENQAKLKISQDWVRRHYSWSTVLAKYVAAIESEKTS